MTNPLTIPLVGAHFRPPAKLVLECLPSGTRLWLEAEIDNPYDPLAIKVLLKPSEIPASQHPRLDEDLPKSGHDLQTLLDSDHVWLGFLARTTQKQPFGNWQIYQLVGQDFGDPQEANFNPPEPPSQESVEALGLLECTLGFGADGKPQVNIQAPSNDITK